MSALPHLIAAAEPPTAAFVASDYIALGGALLAETHGIRVPNVVDRYHEAQRELLRQGNRPELAERYRATAG